MQINNQFLSAKPLETTASSSALPAAANADSGRSALSESSTHSASAELRRYLDLARQVPEVRQDLVAQVKTRLAAGQYLRIQAAQQTADAILRSAE